MAAVRIDTKQINDKASFHLVWEEAFDFPGYYGRNMDAWIDCMSDLIVNEEILNIEIINTEDFKSRLPEVFNSLIECTAFVNNRLSESNQSKIALIFL